MIVSDAPARPDRDKGYDVEFLQPGANYRPKWGSRSDVFRRSSTCRLDISYGHGPRGFLDYFPAAGARHAPTVIFLHGGFWQKGDKSFYSFVAEPYVNRGVSCITLNYDFCPSVRLSAISRQVRAALRWIWDNGDRLGIDRNRLHISGHSAGAHLSAMMMVTDWPRYADGLPDKLLKSAVLISGLYDLAPLLHEPANSQLRLDEDEAREQSPIRHPAATDAPQLIACGQQESDVFHAQTSLYASTFSSPSRVVRHCLIEDCNHFDIMDVYADPDSELFGKALALMHLEQ
ncbi:alpha/beta hydrolase [Pusillimonas caeni]|uniref:alpha/beta hydrolase n=1 Tax=Pusillimonas caeni TaxID=1348472 RepID=UPI000E59F119|nr:alpha/beta hydrolase [Pusillimonas caeni]TFL13120.1 alpha/beta hydrolase [Pusillimonas caeni]